MKISRHLKVSFFLLSLLTAFSLDAQTNYLMDGSPINDCSGFFLDSGGNAQGYGPNEDFTTTICPDGTSGTHIQLIFSGTFVDGSDNLCFFDGPDDSADMLSCISDFEPGTPFIVQATAANPDGCLTVVFTSDGSLEGEGWSAEINCVASCQTILAELVSSDPPVMPVDTGYIDVCPGQRIFLSGAGVYPQDGVVYNHSDFTSEFLWDFGDGASAVGPNVSHTYDEPGGYVIQLTITDQFGCQNTNFLSQRVRVSTTPASTWEATLIQRSVPETPFN